MLSPERAVQEYRLTVRPVFKAWGIDVERPDGSVGPGRYDENGLGRLLSDDAFFRKEYHFLMREILFAREMADNGVVEGEPWWKTPDAVPKGFGLATMRPDGNSWVSADGASSVSVDGDGKPELSCRGSSETAFENCILAGQQLAIQRTGGFIPEGDEDFVRTAFSVAARHGTWQYLTDTEGELARELSNAVLRESDAAAVWRRLAGTEFAGGNVFDVEKALFGGISAIIYALRESLEKDRALRGEEDRALRQYLAMLEGFHYDAPGSYLNSIIAGRAQDPVFGLEACVDAVMTRLDSAPEFFREKMRKQIEAIMRAKASMHDIPLQGVNDVPTPLTAVVGSAIGASSARPSDVAARAAEIEKELSAIREDHRIDDSTRALLRRTARQAGEISGSGARYRGVARAEMDAKDGSFSRNVQASRAAILKAGAGTTIPEYKSVYDRMAGGDDPEFAGHERWRLKDRIRDMDSFMRSKDGARVMVGNIEYEWQMRGTAEGNVLFLTQYDGDENPPLAMLTRDHIISEYRAWNFTRDEETQLSRAIHDVLGDATRIMPGRENLIAAQETEMERERDRERESQRTKRHAAETSRPGPSM